MSGESQFLVPDRGGAKATGQQSPPVPEKLEDTGLNPAFVSDLLLKVLYRGGARTGGQLVHGLRLGFGILDDLLLDLQQRHLIQVQRSDGHGRLAYLFDVTTEGRKRAREAMAQSRYVGPAPVPFETYVDWVNRQSVCDRVITPDDMRRVLSHLVLDEDFIDSVGSAANSGTALFLYGSPGNGKTAVARAFADLADDSIYVPYAISVEGGTIIQVHDPVLHRPAVAPEPEPEPGTATNETFLRAPEQHDPRFAHVLRPAVAVGGELSLDQLELRHDEQAGVYRAPLQLRASGGVFVIDDFGRQRIPARDLLNRWMVPLEERLDYLSLPTGHKLPVPFDCFLVFSTNLSPTELVEEAFLRRLRYKVAATDPTRDQFEVILRRACDASGLTFSEEAVEQVFRGYYSRDDLQPRACHPRDLLAHIRDEAIYRGEVPELTPKAMERACLTYFLDVPVADEHAAPGTAHGRSY